ncbi:MAG: hypothetical protein CL402_02420 [Acidiferrobacteraceae bacterium]|nr:hypothetical protein [Acidiferrobacteraceae bacterium]|tara:strand:- start:31331 stop:31792 length:462 start_codon:yes stop_codon:yes gene_type:complete
MSDDSFRRLDKILQDNGLHVGGSVGQIQEIKQKKWLSIAGPTLAAHSRAIVNDKEVVIFTPSPIWAHSANQRQSSILRAMNENNFEVNSIRIHIHPTTSRKANPLYRTPNRIPIEAAKLCEQIAKNSKDENLRIALNNISLVVREKESIKNQN